MKKRKLRVIKGRKGTTSVKGKNTIQVTAATPPPSPQAPEHATWTYDAPTGVYMNEPLSVMVRNLAHVLSSLYGFVRWQVLGPNRRSFTATTLMLDSVHDYELRELGDVPEPTIRETTVTVKEYGMAVPYLSLAGVAQGNEPSVTRVLAESLGRCIDACVFALGKTAGLKYVPRKDGYFLGASVIGYRFTGRLGQWLEKRGWNTRRIYAERPLDSNDVQRMKDNLDNGQRPLNMLLIGGRAALAKIVREPDFEHWRTFVGVTPRGVAGRIRGVNVVIVPSITNPHDVLLVDEDALMGVIAQEPHLRAAIPRDFGRTKSIAWYGLWGVALAFPSAAILATSAERPVPLRDRLWSQVKLLWYRAIYPIRTLSWRRYSEDDE